MCKQVVLSGIRPSGGLHIGNLLGAVNNMVALMESGKYRCYFFIADLHAGTTAPDFKRIRMNTYSLLAEMLAIGLDPGRCTLFRQSDVPELYQLYTFFCYVTSVSELQRNPVYKEQLNQLKLNGNGLSIFLNYPVLQAADICLYRANLIPVGQDQIPHIELTREIAKRFNAFSENSLFPIPEALLTETPKVPGTDGKKMSKSYGNFIAVADSEKVTKSKIASMVTDINRPRLRDKGHPDDCPVFTLHQFISPSEDVSVIRSQCEEALIGCKNDCKPALAEAINLALKEPRAKRAELMNHPDRLDAVLMKGVAEARKVAKETIEKVRKTLNLSI